MTAPPRVTIVGGGLAGMTAALRLAERGCHVRLYEQKATLGGNLASRALTPGELLDVYPHMYLGWYCNFWALMKDVGVDREARFEPFNTVKQLAPGEFPRFTELINGYTVRQMLANIFSGIGPPADMGVFGYAIIDLLAERENPTLKLDNMSMSGFLEARPYITDPALAAFETYITRVWGIPSYLISASDCRTYLEYCLAEAPPLSWLARGPAAAEVIAPFEAALRAAGVEVELGVEATNVARRGDRASTITLRRTTLDPGSYTWEGTGEQWTEAVEELVLAVPAPTLTGLVRGRTAGERIVEVEPRLAELARLSTQRVPILHVYFRSRIEGIPADPVGLYESTLNLAFTDISQAWQGTPAFAGRTVLAVSCSDPYALAGAHPTENGHQMLRELAEYLNFDAGEEWGQSHAIDWVSTRFHENSDTQLTLDAIGTDSLRPAASCENVVNLSFAGDFCQQDTGLTTIEAAVASGLEAVNSVIRRRDLGAEVEVLTPKRMPGYIYVCLRYALAPSALAAKGWSLGEGQLLRSPSSAPGQREPLLRYLLTPGLPARRQRRES